MKTTIVCIFSIIAIACSTSGIRNNSREQGDRRTGVSDTMALVDTLSTGLVAHYPFDGTATDVGVNGFNAMVHGAFQVADRFGNPASAFEFNAARDYIECGDILDNVFCAPVAKFSVSGWARARTTGSGSTGGGFIIGKNGVGTQGPYQWSVSYVDGNIKAQVFFDTLAGNYLTVAWPMQTHVWFHYALVFDGSLPPTQRLSLYVNGQASKATMLQTVGVIGTTTVNSRQPLLIGGDYSVNTPRNPTGFFNGALDDIRIYNRPLTGAEIMALYHEGGYNPAPLPTVTLLSFMPARNARQVASASAISATFNSAIDASTLTNQSVCVNGSISGRHQSTFRYDAETKTVNVMPKLPFRVGEVVTVTLTGGIKGTLGDPLSRSYSWAFTVRTNSIPGPYHLSQTIPLGNGSNPHSVAVLDVDGNGTLDLAVANFDPGTVTIWKNDGRGAFNRSSTVTVGDGSNCIIAADFDGDDIPDLAVTNLRSSSVSILRNDGTGKFSSSDVAVGSQPMSVAAADLDGDGAIDLAVANSAGNSISILRNDGHGKFSVRSTVMVGTYPTSVVAADLNNDGFTDLAVTNSLISGISTHLNAGDGTFSKGKTINIGDLSWSIAAADLNGDGYLDLAVANSHSKTISILFNTPIRVFYAGPTLKTDGPASMITAVDVNGDGYIDLAVGDNTLNKLTIWRNSVSGSFTADPAIPIGKNPTSVIAADLDGDGKIEFAVTNGAGNSVSILSSGGLAPSSQISVTEDPVTPVLELNLKFSSPTGNRAVYAGESGRVALEVRNTGQATAKNVRARISSVPRSNEIRMDSVLVIGDVAANKTVKTEFSIGASPNVRSLLLTCTVQIVSDEGVPGPTKEMTVAVRSRDFVDDDPPSIILRYPATILPSPLRGMKGAATSTTITVKSSTVPIEGTARDESGIAAVTINGSEAHLKSNGQMAQFVGNVALSPGDNPIEIVAIDNFRNQATVKILVRREGGSAAGQSYALLFAVGMYDSWPPLVNPEPDAQAIAQELKKSYGFRTELLQNVTRDDILTTLRRYAGMKFGEGDQLFIFFAGHGQFDPVLGDGYLVAKDSKLNDDIKTSYVAHSVLRTIVNNIPCRHIFLVVDACFGGTIDPLIAANSRGDDTYGEVSKAEFIQRKLQFRTRRFLTSGGKEYVSDGRPGEHSPFVRKFLEALRSYGGNDGILTISEILQYEEKVMPQPRAGEFGNNEPGSDFVFIAH